MVLAFLASTLDKLDIMSNQNVTPNDGNKGPIKVQLNKATDSGVVDVPKDLFEGILEASNDEQSRRVIMMHIFECFTQSTKAKHLPWKRIHAALILTEELLLNGSASLVSEIASGYHFDLLQQLSFLEQFQWTTDPRAQALVRSKAQSVRRTVAPKLEGAEVIQEKGDLSEDTASTCSPAASLQDCDGANEQGHITDFLLYAVQGEWLTRRGTELKVSGSEASWSSGIKASLVAEGEFLYLHLPNDEKEYHAYLRADDGVLCWSDGDFWRRPQDKSFNPHEEEWHGVLLPPKNPSISSANASAKKVVIGMVCVGHSSDTETESSADETSSQGQRRGQRRMKTRKERTEQSSRISSQSPRQTAKAQDDFDLLS